MILSCKTDHFHDLCPHSFFLFEPHSWSNWLSHWPLKRTTPMSFCFHSFFLFERHPWSTWLSYWALEKTTPMSFHFYSFFPFWTPPLVHLLEPLGSQMDHSHLYMLSFLFQPHPKLICGIKSNPTGRANGLSNGPSSILFCLIDIMKCFRIAFKKTFFVCFCSFKKKQKKTKKNQKQKQK